MPGGADHGLAAAMEQEKLQALGPIEAAEAIVEAVFHGRAAEGAAEGLEGPGDPGAEDVVARGAADDGEAG